MKEKWIQEIKLIKDQDEKKEKTRRLKNIIAKVKQKKEIEELLKRRKESN